MSWKGTTCIQETESKPICNRVPIYGIIEKNVEKVDEQTVAGLWMLRTRT